MTSSAAPGGSGPGAGPSVYATSAPPLPPSTVLPATGGGAGRPGPPSAAVRTGNRLAARLSGTPGRLRLAALGCILLGLLLGGAGLFAVQTKASALEQARRDLDQLATVQQASTALLEADSQSTNLFLAGGLEDARGRQTYLDRLDLAGRALSRASSGAQDRRTRTELQAAHVALTRYAGLVEAARANNRQGFPIGVAYLKQASALLRSGVLPTLTTVRIREGRAVTEALDRGMGGLLAVTGGTALVLLGFLQLWLFRVSRRILNPPLAAATVLGLVALLVAGSLLGAAATRSDRARTLGYGEVVALSDARVAAFDAKANESLTLIARGNGQKYQDAYLQSLGLARSSVETARRADPLSPELATPLNAWSAVHARIRTADDAGDWEGAVALATRAANDPAGGSNAAFEEFDLVSRTSLDSAVLALDRDLAQPIGSLRLTGPALLLVGLVVAAAGWAGISQRLREYR